MNLDKKIKDYLLAKDLLKEAKDLESALRLDMLETCFPKNDMGPNTLNYGDFSIKGTFKNNIALDKAILEELKDDLDDHELSCISYKPTLVLKSYNSDIDTPTLDECITIKPAMPTLEIKEIKDEK